MAVNSIDFLISGLVLPDGSTNNNAMARQRAKSSAAAPTPHWMQLAADASTKEMVMTDKWRMPDDYASGPTLKVSGKMTSATTGNVILEGRLYAITPGDATDADAKGFAAANTSSATAVPGTAGYVFEVSFALTNADSVAAGDQVILYVARDAANASDTATGDMEFETISLVYTTT